MSYEKPTTKEIQTILKLCFKNKQNIHFGMDVTSTILCTHKTNVAKYNQHHYVTQTNFNHIKYQVKIFTNATNIKHNEPWLNDKSFNNITTLHYSCSLKMVTYSLKGVINGATTTIKSIICDFQNNVATMNQAYVLQIRTCFFLLISFTKLKAQR
jgi:hypothetical protein